MAGIKDDLKSGQLRKVYLLYGKESYLKRQYRNLLIKKLVPEDDGMNLTRYGKGADPAEIVSQARTMPFFSDKRVLVLDETELFSSACEELAAYFSSEPDTTYFIITETNIKKTLKAVKEISAYGCVEELVPWTPPTLQKWIIQKVKAEGLMMTRDAWDRFYQATAVSSDQQADTMENMSNEFDKLVSYVKGCGKDRIDAEDVETICTHQINDRVFDMIGCIATGETKQMMKLYNGLLEAREPAGRILSLIEEQFLMLLEISSMRTARLSSRDMVRRSGKPEWLVNKSLRLLGSLSEQQLQRLLQTAASYDRMIKTGRLADTVAVEMLMTEFSGIAAGRRRRS